MHKSLYKNKIGFSIYFSRYIEIIFPISPPFVILQYHNGVILALTNPFVSYFHETITAGFSFETCRCLIITEYHLHAISAATSRLTSELHR
jgi:hypothetical protein